MKTSITYLPEEKQEDLKYLVGLVLKRIPQTEMIILYGSYATGKDAKINNMKAFLSYFISGIIFTNPLKIYKLILIFYEKNNIIHPELLPFTQLCK
jgi:hypothetical protein